MSWFKRTPPPMITLPPELAKRMIMEHYNQHQAEREALRANLSIDIRGEWSHVQARKVIEALGPEVEHTPFRLQMIDVSTYGRSHRFLIILHDTRNDNIIHDCTIHPIFAASNRMHLRRSHGPTR